MKAACLIVQGHYEFDPRVRRKAEALAAAGWDVDVLCLRTADGPATFTLAGVHVETVALGKKRGSLFRYAYEYAAFFLWAFARVHRQMRRKRYAVIDVNTLPDFLIFAPLFARRMGVKLVLDMHEITPEFYRSKYGINETSWIIRILTFVEKLSFDFADHVLTINEPILELLVARGLPRSKATIIMNSADGARFAPAAGRGEPARQTTAFVMIYHGTLTRIYGLDLAIEAFAIAEPEMPGAELWILGSGPEQSALPQLARARGVESKVRLIGQVPGAEIPGWLQRSDVGLLPIRRDPLLEFAFPNKLPEYIISGKAVIISRLGAIQHYFSDEAVAYAEPNDPADVAKQMVRLYRDPALRASLARRAAEEYAPITWDVMKERYLILMDELSGLPHAKRVELQGAEPRVVVR
jgi:glycosyltransferase involved in cell wall biosynthesis